MAEDVKTETALREMIEVLVEQLTITTAFLQLDAQKLRAEGKPEFAKPTEGQIRDNFALIEKVKARLYADEIAA